jgi:KAP-like P-loop domain-containing protein
LITIRACWEDYLEKIFQVPFNLQPMDKPGFKSLVNRFFSVNGSGAKDSKPPDEKLEPSIMAPPTPTNEQQPDVSQTQTEKIDIPLPTVVQDLPAKEVTPALPMETRLDPERLVLTQDEIEDVQRFYVLFQTPRSVKRLANTYSLIRVGVDESGWSDYLGFNHAAPEYRVPLILLAVASAFPSLARPWLLWLVTSPPAQWQLEKAAVDTLVTSNSDTTERIDWEKLKRCLDTVDLKDWPPPDPKALEKWVPRVARYSF